MFKMNDQQFFDKFAKEFLHGNQTPLLSIVQGIDAAALLDASSGDKLFNDSTLAGALESCTPQMVWELVYMARTIKLPATVTEKHGKLSALCEAWELNPAGLATALRSARRGPIPASGKVFDPATGTVRSAS